MGSIPAHAGKPSGDVHGNARIAVHPRPRGEARKGPSSVVTKPGPSPPTRGSPGREAQRLPRNGSIPAHAGKPGKGGGSRNLVAVHPRPRGEATTSLPDESSKRGPSPPTRGSLVVLEVRFARRGSIPAHAGKPSSSSSVRRRVRVHPRPRGEASNGRPNWRTSRGPSPPTRGSLVLALEEAKVARSIPAHAGKPATRRGSAA